MSKVKQRTLRSEIYARIRASRMSELERQTAINEDVIRYMTVRVDEHEAGPSVMMRKSDRERRSRREREEI